MKDCAIVLMFGALGAIGCTSTPPASPTAQAPSGVSSAGSMGSAVAGMTAPMMAAAGSPATPTMPSGAAGAGMVASSAAGTPASSGAAGAAPSSGAAGKSAGASEVPNTMPASGGDAMPGTFKYVYNLALRDLCTTCHTTTGLFSFVDLSDASKAYDSLVNKDATAMMPGQCSGKGKLITPGNCETSIIYSKISQAMPLCGRHMPLSNDSMPTFVPKEGIDALCTWIKAGAKKDP